VGADYCACAIGQLLRDPPTCALPIDPLVALRYRPIAQIAQTCATLLLAAAVTTLAYATMIMLLRRYLPPQKCRVM